jgi:hypothetical protein
MNAPEQLAAEFLQEQKEYLQGFTAGLAAGALPFVGVDAQAN